MHGVGWWVEAEVVQGAMLLSRRAGVDPLPALLPGVVPRLR